MNEAGISSVMGQVQAILNQTTIMSNFDKKEEIWLLIDFLADTLAKDLMINRVNYNINSAASRSKIYFIAISSTYICMKRAFMQGERGFWKGTEQNIRQIIDNQNSSGGGFFSKLLGHTKR